MEPASSRGYSQSAAPTREQLLKAEIEKLKAELEEARKAKNKTKEQAGKPHSSREKPKESDADFDELTALHLRFGERTALLDNTADISYHGSIRTGARKCYVSFPGKYTTGWDALVQQLGGDSVGCVFLCTPEDGLGKHSIDPASAEGKCYCSRIYGPRDYLKLGYLNVVKPPYTEEKLKREKLKARFTSAVVIREDAATADMEHAKQQALQAWKDNGKTASWGCTWYHVWHQQVCEAVAQGQRLQVVFFPDEVGHGKVTMEKLADDEVDLWDGVGCGGSQKAEIATLDVMREKNSAWDYDEIDVASFLQQQFHIGSTVDAWHEEAWCRGTLIKKPDTITKDPSKTFWTVKHQVTGKIFESQHLRHAMDSIQKVLRLVGECVSDAGHLKLMESVQKKLHIGNQGETTDTNDLADLSKTQAAAGKLLEALGHDTLKMMVKEALPEGVVTGTTSEEFPSNGLPSLAVAVHVKSIESLHKLRDDVLTGNLDEKVNQDLKSKIACNIGIEIDKTKFCQLLERSLLSFSQLTPHQAEKLANFDRNVTCWHLSSPAGSGKKIVAIHFLLDLLQENPAGQVLYVAPSVSLGLFFLQWLAARCSAKEHLELRYQTVMEHLQRLTFLFFPYKSFLSPVIDGNRIGFEESRSDVEFSLSIFDESHCIFRKGIDQGFLENIRTKQRLLLSDESQSFLDYALPGADTKQHQTLDEVIRCTQRIVSGAAAFHFTTTSRSIKCCGTGGPPLVSFLFHAKAGESLKGYVTNATNAIWHIMRQYPGLSLHRRLALLVPDKSFLDKFSPLLQEALEEHFPMRKLVLKPSAESMLFLPAYICPSRDPEVREEVLILDEIGNAQGLEHLFVLSIALDAKIENIGADAVTRARLYQSITRAQLVAIVVNEFLLGGWLQFLGLLKFDEEMFTESKGRAEMQHDSAARIMEGMRIEHHNPQPSESGCQYEPSEAHSSHSSEPFEDDEATKLVDQVQAESEDEEASSEGSAGKLELRATCVWDTKHNMIPLGANMRELCFNPLTVFEEKEEGEVPQLGEPVRKALVEKDEHGDDDDDDPLLECKCGFTCGNPTALWKHRARCSLQNDDDKGSWKHGLARYSVSGLRRADDDRNLVCKCGFTCGTPVAWERHQKRCKSGQQVPAKEEMKRLRQEEVIKLPKEKLLQAAAGAPLENVFEGYLLKDDDRNLVCKCGFTCGTPVALERHQKRCKSGQQVPAKEEIKRLRQEEVIKLPKEKLLQAAGQQPHRTRKTLRLLIVRHAESANRTTTNKYPDPGLSEKGYRQAQALALRLQEFDKEASGGHLRIMSSPMLRCLETIEPALELLPLLPGSCICHGAFYEHGCAGLSFRGTPADKIVKRFPQFVTRGFTSDQLWDYRGSSERETSSECVTRAKSLIELLHQQMEELWKNSSSTSPILILVSHQTLGGLLLHLLLEGHSRDWQYGNPKYKLKNASITEMLMHPNGQVTAEVISSDYHLHGIR